MKISTHLLFKSHFFIFLIFCSLRAFSQCPAGLSLSTVNLFNNGDFTAGNSGFSSDHNYCSTPGCLTTEGEYTVASDPSIYQPSFEGADHTTGNGNFLIVNGSTSGNAKVWCQTISIDPNSYYEISYWLSSMVAQSPAQIQYEVNTFPFFGALNGPSSTNNWIPFNQIWTSGITTSATVCLVNMNSAANGNDFGLDDISFKKCECALTIDAGTGGSICKGDSVQLNSSGASSYYWTPTNTLSCFVCDSPVSTTQTTTTYTVTANGPGGCVATDTVTVVVFPTLDLHAGPDTTICPGNSVQLTSSGALFYQWTPNTGLSDAFISNPVASPSVSTTYHLSATDVHGCPQSDSLRITVYPSFPPVVASNDTTICSGHSVVLYVNDHGTIKWTPSDFLSCDDCIQPFAAPDTTVTYVVSVTDTNGCSLGSDSVTVAVDTTCEIILPPGMMIPTAFSPNGDGKNDLLHVLGKDILSYQLDIYNRWGQLIFTATDKTPGWNGTFNGEKQEVGVYIWHLDGMLLDGTHVVKNGNVTLIR